MIKSERFVIAADNHGDMIDPVTEKALFNFMKDFKPTIRIHLGDNFDFRNLRKGASDDEKAQSLKDDWNSGEDFVRRFYDGGKHNVFLRGNHDERLFDLANTTIGVMRDYAHDNIERFNSIFSKAKADVLPYDSRHGVYELGNIKCIHGYFAGKTAVQRHAAVYGNCVFGHIHSIDSCAVERHDEPGESRSIGALCKVDMEYNKKMPSHLRHNNGWVAGTLYSDNTYALFQTTRVGDNFTCSTSFKRY